MSNCWKMEGCHLLICFFKKLPLVRKPCRHSILTFLSCSICCTLQAQNTFRQTQETTGLKRARSICGSYYLLLKSRTLLSSNNYLLQPTQKHQQTCLFFALAKFQKKKNEAWLSFKFSSPPPPS